MADSFLYQHAKPKQSAPRLFLALSVVVFTLFHVHFLHRQLRSHTIPLAPASAKHVGDYSSLEKLRQSVTFLPLKDLRYSHKAMEGHTWFMSSLNDTQKAGEVQYQHFPTRGRGQGRGRVLCLKGHDGHDGARNYYALAWPEALPRNATLRKGLTFVSYNHYDYHNLWHGLSSMVPFASWHLRNGCRKPARWVLFHWGEHRVRMGAWLATLLQNVYGLDRMKIEAFEGIEEDTPVCFEEAVVMRHNEGGMSRPSLEEVFGLLRYKARASCNVSASRMGVGVTMLMRVGGRSFKNDTHVIGIFEKACREIEGCHLQVAYSHNLNVCQQVKLMSETDVLISPHGAQLTNMFLMDKGSSVMEFFPEGWLELAGVGQYVLRWLASWSGMHHQGAWRDKNGPPCPYPKIDRRCMPIYKNAQIGHNDTQFMEWGRTVFGQARARKLEKGAMVKANDPIACGCP